MTASLNKTDIHGIALEAFGKYLESLGYSGYLYSMVPTPYVTERGILLARGTFYGPEPFHQESRALEDETHYSCFLVQDTQFPTVLTLEVKHEGARLASYRVEKNGLYLLDGDLPHV